MCFYVIDYVYVGSVMVVKSCEILVENGIIYIFNSVGYVCFEYFFDKFFYMIFWFKDSFLEDIMSVLYIVFDFIEVVW